MTKFDKSTYQQIRSLKNRRDTLIRNILQFTKIRDFQGIQVNRQECQKVNQQLVALGCQ